MLKQCRVTAPFIACTILSNCRLCASGSSTWTACALGTTHCVCSPLLQYVLNDKLGLPKAPHWLTQLAMLLSPDVHCACATLGAPTSCASEACRSTRPASAATYWHFEDCVRSSKLLLTCACRQRHDLVRSMLCLGPCWHTSLLKELCSCLP
jgi:hypothetical protein